MALALGTALPAAADTTAGNKTTTAFAPGNGNLVLAWVYATYVAGSQNTCTIAGGGVTTWAKVLDFDCVITTSVKVRITLFRAQQTTYGASAAATITFAGTTTGSGYCFAQFTGAFDDTAGNGAACVVQSPTSGTAGDTAGTTGTVTQAAAGAANNRPIACFVHVGNETSTPRTNWTVTGLLNAGYSVPATGGIVEWRSDAFETAATATWASSGTWGGVAAEIKGQLTPSLEFDTRRVQRNNLLRR